jgi:hypothetical protein
MLSVRGGCRIFIRVGQEIIEPDLNSKLDLNPLNNQILMIKNSIL